MARKSRKQPSKTVADDTRSAVGYIRLSVANKDESCFVKNQKLIIGQWATQHELFISHFYIDANYSGSNFERPAFKQMLTDIGAGQINCIVVKDLSRIGREFLSTSYYIEEYFPSKKVRFVSVNDHFDTIDGINCQEETTGSRIRIPITNAFNEQVSLDIRKKTQSALDIKATRGMFMGPRAPFGYRKSNYDRFKRYYSLVSKMAFDIYACNHDLNTLDVCVQLVPVTYYGMNILDYPTGNTDNPENWGFLVDNNTNRCVSLYPLMNFNQCFLSYDTLEGANCQAVLPRRMTQGEAAVEAVRHIGLRQIREIEDPIFAGMEQEEEMFREGWKS